MYHAERRARRPWAVALAALLLCQPLWGAAVAQVPRPAHNGITVGQTKLFDERSLALMLQSVQARLANLDFIDQGSVAAAIGKLQGARLDASSFGLNLTTTPIPGVTTTTNTGDTTTVNTGGNTSLASTGSLNVVQVSPTPGQGTTTTTTQGSTTAANQGSTTSTSVVTPNTTTTVITQPPLTPAAAALPAQTAVFPVPPQTAFGLAPQTLLAQQIELGSLRDNLRLLLEGAVTDRIINTRVQLPGHGDTTFMGPRTRTVVGFQVSLDSPRRYENAVAEVEITVTTTRPGASQPNPPSVVMLLPRENNYNVATVTKNARQFGFGVAVQPINVGVSTQSQKETFFLVQDTDTVAFERENPLDVQNNPNPHSVTLGWQFRPVLGQKVVRAGARQLFATLALPTVDLETGVPGDDINYIATVEARTHWRRYDPKNKAVGDVIEGSESYRRLNDLVIPRGFTAGLPLRAEVDRVDWADAGQGNALVTVEGFNFLPGTAVILGNQIVDNAEKGLFIQGERDFRWVVPGQRLGLIDEPLIAGRFGPPVPLGDPQPIKASPAEKASPHWGLKIARVDMTPLDAQNSTLKIQLRSRHDVAPADFDPVVVIGNRVYGFSDAPVVKRLFPTYMEVTLVAPTRSVYDAGKVVVKKLFWGPEHRAEMTADNFGSRPDDFTAVKVIVLSSGDDGTRLAITGSGFGAATRVFVDGTPLAPGGALPSGVTFSANDPTLLTLFLPKDVAKVTKQIAVSQGTAAPVIIPVTAPAPAPPKPKVDSIVPVDVGDEVYTTVTGSNLGSVEKVVFQGQALKFKNVAENGTSMEVLVGGTLTEKKGAKSLDFISKDGSEVSQTLNVRP